MPADDKPFRESEHPLADIMGAISGLRELVAPIPGEMRQLGKRMAHLESRQDQSDKKVERAVDIATGASRRVSELEGQTSDVSTAMQKHVETISRASTSLAHSNAALVKSNDKQNLELDKQTEILVWIKKWTPVIVAVAALLGTAAGAGVSAYVHVKTLEGIANQGGHAP